MNQQEQNQYQYQGNFGDVYQDSYGAPNQRTYAEDRVVDGQKLMTKTYLGMFALLMISAITALYTFQTGLFLVVLQDKMFFYGCMIAEIVIAIAATRAVERNNLAASIGLTVAYSISSGVTFSVLLVIYTYESMTSIFVLTALLFLGVALFGTITKKDLTGFGQIGIMALWGIILIGIGNMFFKSYMVSNWLAFAGLAIFIGLTAYDTQKIKQMAAVSSADSDTSVNVLAVYGAFTLYLDFVNIFLRLLRLFGNRRS